MNLRKIHPELRYRILLIQQIANSYGIRSTITSGYRTFAEQQRLYQKPEGYPVSPPGCTSHELGLAVDLVADGGRGTSTQLRGQQYLMELGRWAGLSTYPQDPIHFTLVPASSIAQIRAELCR